MIDDDHKRMDEEMKTRKEQARQILSGLGLGPATDKQDLTVQYVLSKRVVELEAEVQKLKAEVKRLGGAV